MRQNLNPQETPLQRAGIIYELSRLSAMMMMVKISLQQN